MKILLDLRSILNKESGDGRFASQIISALSRVDTSNQYIILALPETERFFRVENDNFKLHLSSVAAYSLKECFVIPKIIKAENPDIYHSFTFSYPLGIKIKAIISIYDTTHLRCSEFFSLRIKAYHKIVVRSCANKAKAIMTLSMNSKADIASAFGICQDKVSVVYCGIDPVFRRINADEVADYIKQRFDIEEDFALYVGQIKKHKNIDAVVSAIRQINTKGKKIKLVVCGRGAARKYLNEPCVHTLESPSDVDLLNLYNSAKIFVFPSLYEGFGLPPLEAMACGAPVVSSDAGSLPEVLGDAAYFVNPADVSSIAEGISNVLSDNSLSESLRRKGMERVKRYSWDRAAAQILSLYEKVGRDD